MHFLTCELCGSERLEKPDERNEDFLDDIDTDFFCDEADVSHVPQEHVKRSSDRLSPAQRIRAHMANIKSPRAMMSSIVQKIVSPRRSREQKQDSDEAVAGKGEGEEWLEVDVVGFDRRQVRQVVEGGQLEGISEILEPNHIRPFINHVIDPPSPSPRPQIGILRVLTITLYNPNLAYCLLKALVTIPA